MMKEPFAFAKLATRNDVIQPFYITENFIKAKDETGYPIRIEVVLGRSPQQGGPTEEFNADFHIGHRTKISRRHAMIYWSQERLCFELKSICKNAVRVNGVLYPGSPDGTAGKPARLDSQSCIEIADGEKLFFLLPKGRILPIEKPRLTYEQLIVQVLQPDRQLSFSELVAEIQSRHPYYSSEALNEAMATTWRSSLRTTLCSKSRVFEKLQRVDESGKKSAVFALRRNLPDGDATAPSFAASGTGTTGGMMAGTVIPQSGSVVAPGSSATLLETALGPGTQGTGPPPPPPGGEAGSTDCVVVVENGSTESGGTAAPGWPQSPFV